MGKLKFKGHNKVTRPEHRTPKSATVQSPPRNVAGWLSAQELADLTGPCMVVGTNGDVKALSYDRVTQQFSATDVDLVQAEGPAVHRSEPHSTSQVFTLVPIDDSRLQSRTKQRQVSTFALKWRDTYVSCDLTMSHAISPRETFEVKRCDEHWAVTNNEKCLGLKDGRFAFGELGLVAIRVHARNTVEGRRKQLAEDAPLGVKQAIRQLYKDTKGKVDVSSQLVDRLKQAERDGRLHECVLEEKERYLSRW